MPIGTSESNANVIATPVSPALRSRSPSSGCRGLSQQWLVLEVLSPHIGVGAMDYLPEPGVDSHLGDAANQMHEDPHFDH